MSRWNWLFLALLSAAAGCACLMWSGPGGNWQRVWDSGHQWGSFLFLLGGFAFSIASFFVGEVSIATIVAALVIGGLSLLVLTNAVRHLMA